MCDEHQPCRARGASVLARLLGGEVPAHAVPLGTRERGLEEHDARSLRELHEVLGRAAVRAVDQPPAAGGRREAHRERLGEVRHRLEGDPDRADVELLGGVVLPEVEGVLDQVVVAPGADHAPERVARAGRGVQHRPRRVVGARPGVHRHGLLARRVGQRVRVRDEVQEVVRVQMRDHDGVHVHVVHLLAELREHAVAAVEQHARAVVFHQIARACPSRVLPGRRLAQHREPHASDSKRSAAPLWRISRSAAGRRRPPSGARSRKTKVS